MFNKIYSSKELSSKVCGFDFAEAIEIWKVKPQVANRRLAGSLTVTNDNNNIIEYKADEMEHCTQCIIKRLVESTQDSHFKGWLSSNHQDVKIQLLSILEYFCGEKDYMTDTKTLRFLTRKLLPRAVDRYSPTYELVLWKSG